MNDLNVCALSGIVSGLKISSMKDGKPVTNFMLKNSSGKNTTFYDCAIFGTGVACQTPNNGDCVMIHGNQHLKEWIGKDGEKKITIKVSVHFLKLYSVDNSRLIKDLDDSLQEIDSGGNIEFAMQTISNAIDALGGKQVESCDGVG